MDATESRTTTVWTAPRPMAIFILSKPSARFVYQTGWRRLSGRGYSFETFACADYSSIEPISGGDTLPAPVHLGFSDVDSRQYEAIKKIGCYECGIASIHAGGENHNQFQRRNDDDALPSQSERFKPINFRCAYL